MDVIDRTPPSVRDQRRIQKNCTICSGPYLIVPPIAWRYSTCSRECSTRRRKGTSFGTKGFTCKQCGQDFAVRVSHIKGLRTGDYCSNACRVTALNALPREPQRTMPCRICGVAFRCPRGYRAPDADGKTRGVYCSRKCMWSDDDYPKRRALRKSPTRLERWLFEALDTASVAYEKFATVGRYVPDALLAEHSVILEVDGVKWHRAKVDYDLARDAELAAAGYTVMHFTDIELISRPRAQALLGEAIGDVVAGRAAYRPALLWRPGTAAGVRNSQSSRA